MDFSYIFVSLILINLPSLSTAESCFISKCANSDFPIRFPFQIIGQQPARCGYPGFNLSCNKAGLTTLNLSSKGEFLVRQINYEAQQIQLYDPDGCLPRRLLQGFKFNDSDSPFMPVFSQTFTFLSCPPQLTASRFAVLGCLSNSTNSAIATSSESFAKSMSTSCKVIANLSVPVSHPLEPEGFSVDLNGDLTLNWYEPACHICESDGRLCGYKDNNGQEIGCFDNPAAGESNALKVLRLICLVIVLPTLTGVFGFGCFICFANWGYRLANSRGNQVQVNSVFGPDLEAEPRINLNGLDESTIDSYQKVVLGESRRLPGPNGITCPICLADYSSKDTVRCIPECKHCFHVDCIDQWLRVNSSCPVCRNSPLPSPHHVTQNG